MFDNAAEFVDEVIKIQVDSLMNQNDRPGAALTNRNMTANKQTLILIPFLRV
jgi:hypothetical protein